MAIDYNEEVGQIVRLQMDMVIIKIIKNMKWKDWNQWTYLLISVYLLRQGYGLVDGGGRRSSQKDETWKILIGTGQSNLLSGEKPRFLKSSVLSLKR